MQKILILFLLLTSFVYSKSSDFSVVVKKPFNDALFDITQDYDGDISAVGFSENNKESSTNKTNTYTNAFDYLESVSDAHGHQIHILKVDDNAKLLINKAAKLSRFSEAVALVKTPSNGYFVGGYTLDGSLIIVKLDPNANKIYGKTFGTNNYDRMNNLISLSDGGVLAIGSSITTRSQTDNMFRTGLGLNDIYITRFSKNGQMLWSKKYGTIYDDRGIDAVEAPDGTIIVLGMTRYNDTKDLTLMRISENGDKIWLKHYKSSKEVTPYKVIRLRDRNFLVSITQKDEMNKEQIRLIKFDLQKNVLIDKIVPTIYSSGLVDIKEYSNGSILGVGYVADAFNRDALAMLFDNNLDMLHQEHYGGENYDSFNAVIILRNSQAAAAGIRTLENSQVSNMWIVKLNKDLTMAQISPSVSKLSSLNLYKELVELFAPEIRSNKLIIKEDLSIEFIDKRLYFEVSEYMLTPTQKIFLDNFSTKLMPFLHRYKAYIETLEVNGHTSSEWGGSNFTSRYLKNEKLSMNRSYSVLSYMFETQNLTTQKWLSNILKGSGLSYSKKITIDDNENREKSRRVSFKIILK